MESIIIEVLNLEHGQKVKEFFEKIGKNTAGLYFDSTAEKLNSSRFYGFVANKEFITNYSLDEINEITLLEKGVVLIRTLEEWQSVLLPKTQDEYPKVMEVSCKGNMWQPRVVFMVKNGKFLAWSGATTLEGAEFETDVVVWEYARDIVPPLTVTKEQIAEKFGVTVDKLIIE